LADFWIDRSSELLAHFEVDAVFFWEDMSGKNGQLISPTVQGAQSINFVDKSIFGSLIHFKICI